jgi:release factor glutamine methyltransferase
MMVGEALAEGAALLRNAGAESPSLDASLLLAAALGIDRARLLARRPDPVAETAIDRYRALLSRRASGDCVAYVLGRKEFRGLDFEVSPAVLVPRPDTETLVEAALAWIDRRTHHGESHPEHVEKGDESAASRVLDVCTGSGCIAIALKAERPELDVSASDLSPAALSIARSNAGRLLNPTRGDAESAAEERRAQNSIISFYESDLLSAVPGRFDLIVSNPPYVPSGVIPGLAIEVRREPLLALDGGEDGLDLIRRLVAESRERLDGGGRLLVESGEEQTALVADLMRGSGFIGIEIHRDLAGRGRVTGGSAPVQAGAAAREV